VPLSVAELQPALHHLFHDAADQIAREVGFCRRARKLTGSVFARSLVFSLLRDPASTLDDLADFAEEHLGVSASPQAFDQRFGPAAAALMRGLFHAALDLCFNSAQAAPLPVLRRFHGVYLRDATLVGLPARLAGLFPGHPGRGKGGQAASLKLVFEVEVAAGQLTGASALAGRDNEKAAVVASGPLPPGALLLEDLGFFSGDRLQESLSQGVYVLTRVPAWTAFFDRSGRRLDLVQLLRRAGGWQLEREVLILHDQKLAMRLLAVRLPPEQAQQRRQRARQEARRRGRKVSEKKLDLCEWNILLTNAPDELLSLWEAWELRRVRWQVELVFKAFKSAGGLDRTRSACPWRVLCELYAKLLAMVVQQWALLAAGYVMLRHSARRASRRVRRRAGALLRALRGLEELAAEVARLAVVLHRRCRVQRRRRHPSTLDRLAALDPAPDRLDEPG
jgi:Transposase DDE domain